MSSPMPDEALVIDGTTDAVSLEALADRAAKAVEEGRWCDARADLERAVQMAPATVELHSALGGALFKLREFAAAAEAFTRALELLPDHRGLRFEKAAALLRADDLAAAKLELATLDPTTEGEILIFELLAECHEAAGAPLEAARVYTRLLATPSDHGKYGSRIAAAFRMAGEPTMCEAALEMALGADRANVSLQLELKEVRAAADQKIPAVKARPAGHLAVEVCCPTLNRYREVIRLRNSLPDDCLFSPSLERQPRPLTHIVNELFAKSTGDIVIMAADHLEFCPGSVEAIVECFRQNFPDLDGCVGLNICNLPHLFRISEFCFVALGRKFLRRFYRGDEYQGVFCPQYYHFYGDTEFGLFAEKIGKFAYSERAAVHTWHPNAGNTKPDSTHSASRSRKRYDDAIWRRRQSAQLLWGESFARVDESNTETETNAGSPTSTVNATEGAPFGRRHSEKILSFLQPGATVLSWGIPQAHAWLTRCAPKDCTVVGVAIEEAPPRDQKFQMIVLSGLGREERLAHARTIAGPQTVVVVHQAQRTAYDVGKAQFIGLGHIGACGEQPGCDLWWGSVARPPENARATGALPLVVCFYTKGTGYEIEARKLIASCARNNVECQVVGVESRGSWEANCSMKAEFIRDIWKRSGQAVLWVDSDAIVHRPPNLLRGVTADFAIHRCRDWELLSGTIFFNQTPAAGALLERWTARCRRFPEVWDQGNLDLAWEETIATVPLEALWLPETYCRIFDLHEAHVESDPAIEHFQASRRLKEVVSTVPNVRASVATDSLKAARRASRARTWLLSPRDVTDEADAPTRNLMGEIAEAFGRSQQPGDRVLCVCGNRVLPELLIERGLEVHHLVPAFERSATLSFVAGEFDGVVCYESLDFVAADVSERVGLELKRVSRGSVVVFANGWPDAEDRWPGYSDRLPACEEALARAGFLRILFPPISGNVGTFVYHADATLAARARDQEIRSLQAELQRVRDDARTLSERQREAEAKNEAEKQLLVKYHELTAAWKSRLHAGRILAELRQRELAIKVLQDGLKWVESLNHPRITFEAIVEFGSAFVGLDPGRARYLLTIAAQYAEKLGDEPRLQQIRADLAKASVPPTGPRGRGGIPASAGQ